MDRNEFCIPTRYPPPHSFMHNVTGGEAMVAHLHGIYAAQILINLPLPLTIVPESGKVEWYDANSWYIEE